MNYSPIKIIDLFAGPGGLGEGFSSLEVNGVYPFRISLSVEMEHSAWKTLRLRSFIRQFIYSGELIPDEYYQYLAGELGSSPEEILFKKYEKQAQAATDEALQLTLGEDNDNQVIFDKIKNKLGNDKNWILIGGPPCQAFSLMGRARNKGKEGYVAEEDHRHFLYQEYLKIIENFSPAVFVMENVKGILSSKIDGEPIFNKIKEDLENPGKALNKEVKATYTIYSLASTNDAHADSESPQDPHDFVIKSEDYGIPQARHRVILLGVRDDISIVPKKLEKQKKKITIEQVIGDLPKLRSGLSKNKGRDTSEGWAKVIRDELYLFLKQPSECTLDKNLTKEINNTINTIEQNKLEKGKDCIQPAKDIYRNMPKELKNWYSKGWKSGVCNHNTRGHMDSDLARYLFCSTFAKVNSSTENKTRQSPKLKDFPDVLLPNHKNAKSGKFVDRFKVQEKGLPATTITSHISKDGHYYIHYDSSQCRSLTVREAARIQTFPDNYFFEGNRTQQYVQVGNAVPPLLANKVAKIVFQILT